MGRENEQCACLPYRDVAAEDRYLRAGKFFGGLVEDSRRFFIIQWLRPVNFQRFAPQRCHVNRAPVVHVQVHDARLVYVFVPLVVISVFEVTVNQHEFSARFTSILLGESS